MKQGRLFLGGSPVPPEGGKDHAECGSRVCETTRSLASDAARWLRSELGVDLLRQQQLCLVRGASRGLDLAHRQCAALYEWLGVFSRARPVGCRKCRGWLKQAAYV